MIPPQALSTTSEGRPPALREQTSQQSFSDTKLAKTDLISKRAKFYAPSKQNDAALDHKDGERASKSCATKVYPNPESVTSQGVSGVRDLQDVLQAVPKATPAGTQTASQKYSAADIERKKQQALQKRQNRLKLTTRYLK